MKILMVGNKDSGKTTYMASSFRVLENGINNFYIDTDDDSKRWFQRVSSAITNGSYPSATDKRQNYSLKLYHWNKEILDFEWVDYNGGVITEKDVTNFKQDIDDSDSIMIFLEADALWKKLHYVNRLKRIISLIQEHLEKYAKPLLSVIIVVTKYDKIPNGVSFEEVTKDLQNFVEATKGNKKIYARIVPISCTANGFYNVELPLLDVLDSALEVAYLTNAVAANAYEEQAKAYANQSGIINSFVSWWFRELSNRERATVCYELAQEKVAMFKSLEAPIQALRQYISSYEIIFPNASTPEPQPTTNVSRRRFIEF